ncbi:tetratricopeptide repeat protein [Thermopolyspora sp. NPDC052614]|uniref:tetratricopeptide repeat protein n=1 Tax=Thermopolyspora sp. NPDC052614 TaxID=3155682 RepID=UPI00343DC967
MPALQRRGDDERAGSRRTRLAAPAAAGSITAVATSMLTSIDIWDLPVAVRIAITVVASLLVGVGTWATSLQGGGERRPVRPGGEDVPPPAQLPPRIAHFTGRGDVLAELRDRFAAAQRRRSPVTPLVVSVYGQGGVGKSALVTRFAHEVLRDFPDGQLYFDLRGTAGDVAGDVAGDETADVRPEEVLTGFLRALGVRLTTDPGGLRELQKLWWTWTKDRRILIFLDNAQNGDQVQALIPPEPGCAVLVTSRRPLFLRNDYDIQLGAFTEAQGIELLARLAGDERVAADVESAQEIVRLCGHLPLAISICGGRLATRPGWSLRELADRLRDERRRLDHLELGPQVDKSVRASVQLSYDACTDLQRRLLRLLGLLTAPDVRAWAAGELLDTSQLDGADQLEALVDTQLAETSGRDATGEMRYRLHDLVRLFAREQTLREDPEPARRAAIERFLSGYRRRAEAYATYRWPQDWSRRGVVRRPAEDVGERTDGDVRSPASDWFTAERLGLLAAVHLARDQRMWEQAWGIGRAFCSLCHSMRAFWADWRSVAEITYQAAEAMGDDRALGIALLERAVVVGNLGNAERARADAERALEIFNRLGETWWAARAMRSIGMTLFNSGNLDRGQNHLLDALGAFEAIDDPWWLARTQRNLAELRLAQRSYAEARELVERALAVFQRDGNRYSEAQTQRVLGEVLAAEARVLSERGDGQGAAAKYILAGNALRFAIKAFRDRHEEWEEARALRAAGGIGDPQNLLLEHLYVQDAKQMLERLGDSWGVARSELAEGYALRRRGRLPEAISVLRLAAAHFAELGDRWWQARSLRALATCLIDAGDPHEGRRHAVRALDIYTSLGNAGGMDRARQVVERADAELAPRDPGLLPRGEETADPGGPA